MKKITREEFIAATKNCTVLTLGREGRYWRLINGDTYFIPHCKKSEEIQYFHIEATKVAPLLESR